MDKAILLVDDLQMFLEIEKEYLQYNSVGVLTAKDGLEALDVVRTKRPDLVFMDLEMPRMDGATCCKAIKADSAFANVPVVMVTSNGNKDECRLAGCDHFLKKPVDRDVFLDVARKFIPDIDRREKRVTINIDCLFRVRDESITCHLHDLSMGGAFVVTDHIWEVGSVVQISFTLPEGAVIDCAGRIAWTTRKEANRPKGLGIKFSLMTKDAQSALKYFLNSVN